jgi:hypothetical protein
MPSSFLLSLPRELRDMIYETYVWSNEGYAYNYKTNKILRADGNHIELSLSLTCRQVAYEMSGLALRSNTITISTYFSESTRESAGLFHAAIRTIFFARTRLLGHLAPKLLTPRIAHTVTEKYPMLAPLVNTWFQGKEVAMIQEGYSMVHHECYHCGEAPSLWNEFVQFTLKQLSQHPNFMREAGHKPVFWTTRAGCNAIEAANASFDPWTILDDPKLDELTAITGIEPRPYLYFDHLKYCYSAASVALRFLESLTPQTRKHVRNLVLREDWQSVASPACHGRGLIPHCVENPELRILRYVNLWQNGFPVHIEQRDPYVFGLHGRMDIAPPDHLKDDKLSARGVTQSVGTWIVESLLLPSLGMPQGSYTLVLDGNPIPEQTAAVFRIVQRDAAWQTALDLRHTRQLIPELSWLNRRLQVGYFYEMLPQAVRDISNGTSPIRCNFDPGVIQSAEALVDARTNWSLQQWRSGWDAHEPQDFQTHDPLPPWSQLRWQRVTPL